MDVMRITEWCKPLPRYTPASPSASSDNLELATGTGAQAFRKLEAETLVITGGRRGTLMSDPANWHPAFRDRAPTPQSRSALRHPVRQLSVSTTDAMARVSDALDARTDAVSPTAPEA